MVNYIRTGNIHILVDANMSNTDEIPELKGMGRYKNGMQNQVFHIFITDRGIVSNGYYHNTTYLEEMFKSLDSAKKVVVHIPERIGDVKLLVDEMAECFHKVRVVKEKVGPKFRLQKALHDQMIEVKYEDDGIVIPYAEIEEKYKDYFLNDSSDGVITNTVMQERPELFKERIVERFKQICPPGVLQTFKDDDDIFDYVTGGGEWAVF